MNDSVYDSLRRNVSFLGRLLGETIAAAEGEEFLGLIECIRTNSRAARDGDRNAWEELLQILGSLSDDQLLPVARAFSQFLNLANIAEQRHHVSREMDAVFSASSTLDACFAELNSAAVDRSSIHRLASALNIQLVLTAHPTEITRRTLIHKHGEISDCLARLELSGLTDREVEQLHARLRELIAQIWYGSDFREERPSPVDEARWGFAVIEDSLWKAVPEFLRRLDKVLLCHCGERLAPESTPVRFAFWMGGDRDGNPNVTARVTQKVLLLARWQAADLYLRDINRLIEELSMTRCTDAMRSMAGGALEPYRAVLRQLRKLLRGTLAALEQGIEGGSMDEDALLQDAGQLSGPLQACYDSMMQCGMQAVADRGLLDLIRRVHCFGVHLVELDIRQESSRHTAVLAELTSYLGLGNYAAWSERERRDFLTAELASRRPLIPGDWIPSTEAQEVLDTCAVIASQPREALGAYVISMARDASDVLAVCLLLKSAGCPFTLPVAPLFETLDDLENASDVIRDLLDEPVYCDAIAKRQMVMIGYSDSSKDAGVMAASWAQYRAQEAVAELCEQRGVELTLFHGRGGTIGRGGGPAHSAILSQPPGTLRHGLRVTEQGEMIRAKLGLSSQAVKTLALYTSAVCKANLMDPPVPKQSWRDVMDKLSRTSCESYRAVVRSNPDFVAYFRHATPEQELGKLPLGSRPARRSAEGGIESLRAIPWIFAWMQNRLMLPAWLGVGTALRAAMEAGETEVLREMSGDWPFFSALLSMQGMVFDKSDTALSEYYDKRLVPAPLQAIGSELRDLQMRDVATLEALVVPGELQASERWARESIRLRNIYTDPLNCLQVEALARLREHGDRQIELAVMATIAGVAAGMRNTG
jgi:phosphoenolpyruvate carboxylase